MPGKNKRGKRPYQSHKSKAIARQSEGDVQPVAPAARPTPASPSASVEPKSSKSTAAAAASAVSTTYPFVKSELARIGLLFGIILIILIVLSIVLK